MKDRGCVSWMGYLKYTDCPLGVIIRIQITWGKTAENFLCEKSINALSRSFVFLRINIIYILCPAAWESYPEGITEKKRNEAEIVKIKVSTVDIEIKRSWWWIWKCSKLLPKLVLKENNNLLRINIPYKMY